MEHVVKALVPIRIKNTLNPKARGTLIDPCVDYTKSLSQPQQRYRQGHIFLCLRSSFFPLRFVYFWRVFGGAWRKSCVMAEGSDRLL